MPARRLNLSWLQEGEEPLSQLLPEQKSDAQAGGQAAAEGDEPMMFSRMVSTGKSWCCLLRELLAEPFALVPTSSSIHAPLLGLSTARDAVGARQVGGAQVKVNKTGSSLVTGPEAKLGVVELVQATSIDSHTGAWA